MDSEKLQLSLINRVKIRNLINESQVDQGQAGFVKNGSLAWIVRESSLEILSVDSGARVAYHNFGKQCGSRGGCSITSVEEVDYHTNVCLLAVATEITENGPSAGVLSLFCVHGSKVLGSLDFCDRITSICYISRPACAKSVLKCFKGTVAVGTDQGKLFLIDLMIPKNIHDISMSPNYDSELFHCEHILANIDQQEIASFHRKVTTRNQQMSEKSFFSIQLEVLNDSGAIVSMLCMPNLYILAVGLSDGRLVLYNLEDLQPFHLAHPPDHRAPLTHMSFVEPTDDPKCVVYIWTFHSSPDGAIAVMHSLMFSSKVDQVCEGFKSCSVRLTMPIFVKDTEPVCCRSMMRTLTQDDEDVLTLSVLAWTSRSSSSTNRQTNVMVFDLNQWYKEEMPFVGDWRKPLKYVAVFELQDCTGLDVIVNEHSVFPFNSILRPEEHFYPNSLSFDVCVLENNKFSNYRWFGIQNIVLQQFNVIGPQIILEPSYYFNEFINVAILPQFSDGPFNMSTPLDQKREFLLSVALEYNFNGFLKKCACAWADGSYLGKDDSIGIGLSTLTDWIWHRAVAIKDVCNTLCKPLFDYSEQRIDYGTQKQLSQCCKQLKVLSDLSTFILKDYRQYIPEQIYERLKTQSTTIKMASDYQEVLQWLLNVGLLPEGLYDPGHRDHQYEEEFLIVPYPYNIIRSNYEAQRMKLAGEFDGECDEQETSKFLFIDAFIEQECKSDKLREIWKGVYPPKSIQTLLRTLLVPDIPLQSKHVIFVYLFMDITTVLSDSSYTSIVRNLIKFPAVFKMNPAMIKRTQAFWNLDNGNLDTAVEELISPLSHDKHLPLWQRELLIGALLKQNANSLALRALRCPGSQISADLEMLTLLSNNLMSEALKVQRASGDRNLLVKLFEKILHSPNYEQLLELTLTTDEGIVLAGYLNQLKDSGMPNHVNIHFVFLLQRAKFLDAAQLVESLGHDTSMNLEPPKQVLNAYYATMESTTRRLTTMVQRDDVQVKESPLPLSVSLIRSRCNAKNDIYQRTVQSINEAAYEHTDDMPFIGSPKLGIFEYKQPTVSSQDFSFALEINEHGKRKAVQKSDQVIRIEDFEAPRLKKQRLDDSAVARKSFMDKRIKCLTVFKDTKPNFNFSTKSHADSMKTTPDRVQMFGSFLNTPIVQKKTPPSRQPDTCPATPHSILKTRSNRGSLSPAPSRFSEFGDDNKSVKSITFAALPDSRDTSLNDSTMMEDDSFNEHIESSAEVFESPIKSPEANPTSSSTQSYPEGPKARKALSRSITPIEMAPALETKHKLTEDLAQLQSEEAAQSQSDEAPKANQDDIDMQTETDQPPNVPQLNDTISNSSGSPVDDSKRPLHARSVLGSDFDELDSDQESDTSAVDKSIYGYVRRSIFPPNYADISETYEDEKNEPKPTEEESEDSEMVEEEHFEEVELSAHSDYDESNEKQEEFEYGDVDLDDSEASDSSSSKSPEPSKAEIICLDSSDDDDVETVPVILPPFGQVGKIENTSVVLDEDSNDEPANIVEDEPDMFSIIDDRLEQQEEVPVEIESPPFEAIAPTSLPTADVGPNPVGRRSEQPIDLTYPVSMQAQAKEVAELPLVEEPQLENLLAPPENLMEEEAIAIAQDTETVQDVALDINPPENQAEVTSTVAAIEFLPDVPQPIGEVIEEAVEVPEAISEEVIDEIQPTPEVAVTVVESNVSVMSDDNIYFLDATDDTINQALIASDHLGLGSSHSIEMTERTNELDLAQLSGDFSMETAKESFNTTTEQSFDVKESSSNTIESDRSSNNSPRETLARRRSVRSQSKEPIDRHSRGQSVPMSKPSATKSRSQRAATEDIEDPKKKLKSKVLKKIEEELPSLPSPGVLTRSRSQLLEAEGSLTPLHSTSSIEPHDLRSSRAPSTPRRMSRAASKESLASITEKSPDEPGVLKRQRSQRIAKKSTASVSEDDNDDAKSSRSTRSNKSTSKKKTPASQTKSSPDKTSPMEEMSASNRRLTRRQLQVIEKSRQLTEKIASGKLRATRSDDIARPIDATDESDNESVKSDSASVSSKASHKRKTPRKTSKGDDSSSVSSKKSSKRRSTSPKRLHLSVIPEETTIDAADLTEPRSKRARK